MEANHFDGDPLCGGIGCMMREYCVRYMGNIDLDSTAYNPVVELDYTPGLTEFCPYFLGEDNGHYPQANKFNE